MKPMYNGDGYDLHDAKIRDELDEIVELFLQAEAKGGWVTAICESCRKVGKAYQEPLPYGTVRLGITHWICSDCIRKGTGVKNG